MKKLMLLCLAAFGLAFGAFAGTINLKKVTGNKTAKDGDVITGTLAGNYKISIADGAKVTLRRAHINNESSLNKDCAGLTCNGSATIVLEDENEVNALGNDFPGIYVPKDKTLRIEGFGSLKVHGKGYAAGIGGGKGLDCGNIVIAGGIIQAFGGRPYGGSQEVVNGNLVIHPDRPGGGPGIGAGDNATCGWISFNRGNVTSWANGELYAYPAIGASAVNSSCGNVYFNQTIGKIEAVVGSLRPSDENIVSANEVDYGVVDDMNEGWAGTNKKTVWTGYPGQKKGAVDSSNYRTLTVASQLGRLTGSKTFGNYQRHGQESWGEYLGWYVTHLKGELSGDHKISVADGAEVVLNGVTIGPTLKTGMPGITFNGDATLILKGNNYIKGCGEFFPGIFVPQGKTLTIIGDGKLTVVSGGKYAAAIGGSAKGIGSTGTTDGYSKPCGNVKILSGEITAIGGEFASALGGFFKLNDTTIVHGGTVSIFGGSIRAQGGVSVADQDSTNWSRMRVACSGNEEFFHWNGRLDQLPEEGYQIYATAYDGTTITGALPDRSPYPLIKIADGAKVKFKDVTIRQPYIFTEPSIKEGVYIKEAFYLNYFLYGETDWRHATRTRTHNGIYCEGNAEITLEGTNYLEGSSSEAGLRVGNGRTVTIKGDGKLHSVGGINAAGIGESDVSDCGSVVVESGVIVAEGGTWGRGMGTGASSSSDSRKSGTFTFNGGSTRCISRTGLNPIGCRDESLSQPKLGPNMQVNEKSDGDRRIVEISWNGKLGDLGGGSASASSQMSASAGPRLRSGRLRSNPVELEHIDAKYVAGDGMVITGTLSTRNSISIAHDATVTLKDAKILGTPDASSPYAGLTCLGNATIILEGDNEVSSFHESFPAISVPTNCTLVITGIGSLVAGNENETAAGAGIGGGSYADCGNIIISNGTITAYGGEGCAGIGGGSGNSFGTISIVGGIVTATGGNKAAGIGTGDGGTGQLISIGSGVARVIATSPSFGEPIGEGKNGTLAYAPVISTVLSSSGHGSTRTLQWNGNLGLGLEGDLTAFDNTTIYGVLHDGYKTRIMIAPGAHVTLKGASINSSGALSADTPWAGITCLGDATITIKNDSLVTENTVKTFNGNYPAIFVPGGSTLTIDGDGTLTAANLNGAGGAGIGGGSTEDTRWCGNIVVDGGDVTAYGGTLASGIGGGDGGWCDGVVIGAGITHVKAYCGDGGNAHALCHGNNGDSNELPYIANGIVEIDSGTYFREFAPDSSPDTDLSTLTGNAVIQDGAVVSGTISRQYNVSIAAGAEVTLNNITIPGSDDSSRQWAGITCLGDATIWLEGVNNVKGSYHNPGIYVPAGHTLTIKSKDDEGVLIASAFDFAAGIGGGYNLNCGNIVIDGGGIYAGGGRWCAGIGAGTASSSSSMVSCGDITFNGGYVTGNGGEYGAGIGAGSNATCGNININSGIKHVEGMRGSAGAEPIGAGSQNSTCDNVNVASGLSEKLSDDGSCRNIVPNIDLSSLPGVGETVNVHYKATISGTLGGRSNIHLCHGSEVTLRDVVIRGVDSDECKWAGITCSGDVTIILEGTNTVTGFHRDYPGIYVPPYYKLTIKGTGRLDARSNGNAAGIGGGRGIDCGDIVISSRSPDGAAVTGCTVISEGGAGAAGIGGGAGAKCGKITIDYANSVRVTTDGVDANGTADTVGAGSAGTCKGVVVSGTMFDATHGRWRLFTNKRFNLSWAVGDMTLLDGMTVLGTLPDNYKVSIAAGAHVTLSQATIQGEDSVDYKWAGLTCEGDATITLTNYSRIKGFCSDYPGIYVPEDCTLTINGNGTLRAESNGWAAGIGASFDQPCGNIVIDGGRILAHGGTYSAGIGGTSANCGDITINGGTVWAYGGSRASAIGAGFAAACGTITIGAGITSVTATLSDSTPGDHIGKGYDNPYGADSTCAGVVIDPDIADTTDGLTRTLAGPTYVDLSTVTSDMTITDRSIVFGTLAGNHKLSIAAGAKVTLRDAVIAPGIDCLGDVTIVLEGANSIDSLDCSYPGIFIPSGYTLTILGEGSLGVTSASTVPTQNNYGSAAIGAGWYPGYRDCGNIIIESGTIAATSGVYAASIGGVYNRSCGSVTISNGITRVSCSYYALGNTGAGWLGAGEGGTAGTVTVDPVLDNTASAGARIISPPWDGNLNTLDRNVTAKDGTCITGTHEGGYEVSIEAGAEVTLDSATYAGTLTCNGDATIILAGENAVTAIGEAGFDARSGVGIYVPQGSTLTITGDGLLDVKGADGYTGGAGIGGGDEYTACGNVVIESGTVIATGGGSVRGAAGIGGNCNSACGDITIGPGVTKVVAKVMNGGDATPIGLGYCPSPRTCGAITVDQQNLTDTTSADGLTRTITRVSGADAIADFNAWKAEKNANGANIVGAWDARDANGVANVFRYAFDRAGDDFNDGKIIIDFASSGDGQVAIQTLPVVNGKGLFFFTIVASDNADGTGNVAEYPLSLEPDGITVIAEEYNPKRFFRVRVSVGQ